MNTAQPLESTEAAHRQSIERVLDWMAPRLAEPVDLDSLAKVAVMGRFHFLRTFRRLTGVPPKQFLAALRVEAAKRLLLDTDRSVLDVCFDVGYTSLGTFSRRFTELVGMSPGRFRQLTGEFYPDLDSVLDVAASCPLPEGSRRIEARVTRMRPDQVVFAGLFDTPIPQGRPLSCAVLLAHDDEFEVATDQGGEGHLFAVAMDSESDPIDLLVGGSSVQAVAHAGPLDLDQEEPLPEQQLRLSPLDRFDPPMLLALPLLLHERVSELGYEDELDVDW